MCVVFFDISIGNIVPKWYELPNKIDLKLTIMIFIVS